MQKTNAQRAETLRRELLNLKAELRKAKGAYKRAVLCEEIRSVARKLAQLTN